MQGPSEPTIQRVKMKQIYIVLALLLWYSMGEAQKIQMPLSTRRSLSNGLTVILMEYRKVPVVHYRLITRGGSAQDPDGLEGIASITTALMRQGTATRTATQLAQEVDFMGGTLSASAGFDYCAVNGQVLKKDMDAGLDLFSDIILNPVFSQEELERERKQRLADLEAIKEDPHRAAGVMFNKTVYGTHPYGRQSSGTKTSIGSFTQEQVLEYYRRVFLPNNSILVVVGDFVSKDMLAKIESKFGGWKSGEMKDRSLLHPAKINGKKVVLVDKPDATQTQIWIGNIGVDAGHPDNFAIDVANTVFGSSFTSRLMDELRVKRSLTYGASSSFPSNLYGGTYVISTFTKNETLTETVDVVLEEIRKYREKGGTVEEVKKAQNYLSGEFARSLQTPEALAFNITSVELYGFPKNYLDTYIEKLKAVSNADVQRVVSRHFLLNDLLFVFVGPAKLDSSIVERYGPTSVVDLKDAVQ